MIKSKKAESSYGTQLFGIVLFLLILAFGIDSYAQEFQDVTASHRLETLTSGFFDVITKFLKIMSTVFLWDFSGTIPWYIDAFLLLPLRIYGYVLIYRVGNPLA